MDRKEDKEKEGAEEEKEERRGEERRSLHSRRLSCSPSAYHSVTGQDLYVEFIVAESALLRFMDVFRRNAAARVIYRSSLILPPRFYSFLFFPLQRPSSPLSPSFSRVYHLSIPSVVCPDSADRGGRPRESEGFLMNATTESLFFCIPFSLFRSNLLYPTRFCS